uniref:Lysozyme like 4 n=1 Tax=Molossus molossus TaxID=27622 RepID=A0A7J8DBW7_MOLMO|nr:lysozyme like 4 [Molossus molossus]
MSTALELILDLCFSKLQLLKRWQWFAQRIHDLVMRRQPEHSVRFSCWGRLRITKQDQPVEQGQIYKWACFTGGSPSGVPYHNPQALGAAETSSRVWQQDMCPSRRPAWTTNCQNSNTLARWLDGCKL